jgi:hypothetical protein
VHDLHANLTRSNVKIASRKTDHSRRYQQFVQSKNQFLRGLADLLLDGHARRPLHQMKQIRIELQETILTKRFIPNSSHLHVLDALLVESLTDFRAVDKDGVERSHVQHEMTLLFGLFEVVLSHLEDDVASTGRQVPTRPGEVEAHPQLRHVEVEMFLHRPVLLAGALDVAEGVERGENVHAAALHRLQPNSATNRARPDFNWLP